MTDAVKAGEVLVRWVLGTELEASERVSSAPNCLAVPPAPIFLFLYLTHNAQISMKHLILLYNTSGVENARQHFVIFFLLLLFFVAGLLTPLL